LSDKTSLFPALAFCFATLAGGTTAATTSTDAVTVRPFGQMPDGRETHLYTLKGTGGFQADVSDYGGILVRLLVPDRAGRLADVVLGFDRVADYVKDSPYFGAIIGRVANRIADARFTLDGRTYALQANQTGAGFSNLLHGGRRGFDKVLWTAEPAVREGRPALRLRYTSIDGEEGFPGNLAVEVVYSLTAEPGLRIDCTATTDRATPVNLTYHSYFNLAGEGAPTALDHELTLRAHRYTPIKKGGAPTGELLSVTGTPLDFTTPRPLGARIGDPHPQLRLGSGYDHNFVLDPGDGSLALAATLCDPVSGRVLEVLTTEPGLQLYTANFLNGRHTGKSGRAYARRSAVCLEPQHFPDAVNQPAFPNTILRPGETRRSTTVYRFTTR
jgi:aldose 1-epimerase